MEMKNHIKYDDNFLSQDNYKTVIDYCLNANYFYGESDDYGLPPTGMISKVNEDDNVYKIFRSSIESKCSFLDRSLFYRMYVNCFAPNEQAYFHQDGEGITFLYYATEEWNLQNGGETQFYIDGNIIGVPPISNRLVMFDGMIQHRATSFRNHHRFTIAIKYGYNK